MKHILSVLAICVSAITAPTEVQARAGTLISCDMIQTREGIRYVGTYCADYQCTYQVTRVFSSYCPYSIR